MSGLRPLFRPVLNASVVTAVLGVGAAVVVLVSSFASWVAVGGGGLSFWQTQRYRDLILAALLLLVLAASAAWLLSECSDIDLTPYRPKLVLLGAAAGVVGVAAPVAVETMARNGSQNYDAVAMATPTTIHAGEVLALVGTVLTIAVIARTVAACPAGTLDRPAGVSPPNSLVLIAIAAAGLLVPLLYAVPVGDGATLWKAAKAIDLIETVLVVTLAILTVVAVRQPYVPRLAASTCALGIAIGASVASTALESLGSDGIGRYFGFVAVNVALLVIGLGVSAGAVVALRSGGVQRFGR